MSDAAGAWQGKADRAYAQLRHDIETGELAPGQSLSEVELVTYTGASRTPVREAIRRLASEGLIDLQPRRAPTVSRISLRGARALFDFRRLIEPEAVRVVAQKAAGNSTLREDLGRLLAAFTSIVGADYSPDFAALFRDATAEFDALVARHTPNEYLARAITDLRPHSARLRYIAHSDRSRLQESVHEHILMINAIADGDPDAAAVAMTDHLHHVDQAIFRQLLSGEVSEILVS
ncbi:GntR family transcriptional regulator [Microbacterium arborescens]|uniref:GntR family transcriptional regulator n=1 Tax=Microbacterium arborescens TaxID=33883 RepID=UPI002788424E|nr:GntR family transcriptional regulator [Microbacterium arborescens]MDQ1218012.1 DNA-binding GntR family transcriptional regulator [Microbacterium arborescens]